MNNLKTATNLFIVNRLVAVVISLLLVSVLGYAGVCLYNNFSLLSLGLFLVGNFFLTAGVVLLISFSINRTALPVKALVATVIAIAIGLGCLIVPIIAKADNDSYGPALWAVVDAEEKKEEPKQETPKQEVVEETPRYEASSTDLDDNVIEETSYGQGGGEEAQTPTAPIVTPVTTPEVIEVVSPPIELVPDETIPVEPETPVIPAVKPVVKILFDGFPIIYVGETYNIFANVIATEKFDFVQSDVTVSEESVLSAEAEEAEGGIDVSITGLEVGESTIQLPEGMVVDNGEGSDASNVINIRVVEAPVEEPIIDEPVVEEPVETPVDDTPVVDEPVETPVDDTPVVVDTPSEPIQLPEVPENEQAPDAPVFE